MLGPEHAIGTFRRNPPAGGVTFDLAEIARRPDQARQFLKQFDFAAIYCAGALTHVDGCESAPEEAMRVNCHGPAALASAAGEAKVPFVFFSTEYVFDGENGPYAEDAGAHPISVYGRSKWLGEQAICQAHPGALILRTTVVYGIDPAGKNFLYALRRACLERRPFRVPRDQVSTPTYNRDLAQAAIGLVQAEATGVFHVCGSERLSRYEFAHRAARAMGLDAGNLTGVTTRELAQAAPRPLSAGLLTGKLARTLPGLRMHSIEEGVREWMAEDPPPGSARRDFTRFSG